MEHPNTNNGNKPPRSVINGILFIISSIILSLIIGIRNIATGLMPFDIVETTIIGNLLSILIFGFLCAMMWRGKRWARNITAFLYLVWLAPNTFIIISEHFPRSDIIEMSRLLEAILKITALVLLYTRSSDIWFLLGKSSVNNQPIER